MRNPSRSRRGFSIVEMLVALTITSTLLTAALAALDSGFKSYKHTTDGASTHVVSRITMHRIMTMIRTGTDFAPYPVDPLAQPSVESTWIEFNGFVVDDNTTRIVRIERRDSATTRNGVALKELWYVQQDYVDGELTSETERPLIVNLTDVKFTLDYDVGPRLLRATVDMTVRPDDGGGAAIYSSMEAPTVRFVSSVSPRRLEATE